MYRSPLSLRPWLVLGMLILSAAPAAAETSDGTPPTRKVVETFPSGTARITAERFEPAADGKYPAVLLLHAVDGLETGYGEHYRGAARRFAARGYVVVLVHYFDRTGADPETVLAVRTTFLRYARGDGITEQDRQTLRAHFSAWTETVRDAVAYTRALPNVDGRRVGLVGFSLGAHLALAAGAQADLKLAAVVDLFGALPEGTGADPKQLPPTLIVHGDKDTVVGVGKARALARELDASGVPHEVEIYAGVGHVFLDDAGNLTLRARLDALDAEGRIAAFLEKHVQREAAVASR